MNILDLTSNLDDCVKTLVEQSWESRGEMWYTDGSQYFILSGVELKRSIEYNYQRRLDRSSSVRIGQIILQEKSLQGEYPLEKNLHGLSKLTSNDIICRIHPGELQSLTKVSEADIQAIKTTLLSEVQILQIPDISDQVKELVDTSLEIISRI